jgi:hypothetical protein
MFPGQVVGLKGGPIGHRLHLVKSLNLSQFTLYSDLETGELETYLINLFLFRAWGGPGPL